ncbi:MAG TPA: pantoate--beta-alanine ligase [Anaeromyxobacter sp.]|nr:pantoate--beta-alanine ligase [Anaeromyxobacter sp.]
MTDPAAWQVRCLADRAAGARIALVPTMGFLHEGHLSLMREARRRADAGGRRGLSVATIFVNPTQFGPSEDLSRYPRDLEGDLAKCAAAGVDRVLAPSDPRSMFAPSHETWVEVERVSEGLCGASRPGHFRGVATVVAKLFHLTVPHVAFFGEKDFQQLAVIRAMVRDLAFGIEVVGMPIVREKDGLALSSRNAYLSAEERGRALALSRSLLEARDAAARGERDADALRARARERLEAALTRVDYVEIVHPETLAPVARAEPGSVMLVAAFVGKTRLIDNVRLP